MKRTITALMLAVLLLAGCSASVGQSSNKMEYNSTGSAEVPNDNGYYDKGDYNYGWAEDSSAEIAPSAPTAPDASVMGEAKIIYTADVTLETREFDDASSKLNALVLSTGGYFESRQLNQGGSYRSIYCVIRVPAERFAEFIAQSGEVAHLTYCNEYSENVSEVYYDIEARLTTQRTKLQRLQELLAQAKDMSDIITIENEISNTELQIEYLTGRLRGYDSLIEYSTVNLSLREVYRLSDEEPAPVTFGDRIAVAFDRGIDQLVENAEDLVLFVVQNWLNLIVWGVIIFVAAKWIRRHRKNRGEKTLLGKKRAEETDEN